MDLQTLNSLTKYPSIPTFHTMDRGKVTPAVANLRETDEMYGTEKVDGTNARIIFIDDDYFIGSREELLTARFDRIPNPAQGIIEATSAIADRWVCNCLNCVIFGEVYGGAINGYKQYTSTKQLGFRVFDVMPITNDFHHLLRHGTPASAANWRDTGGQPFAGRDEMLNLCDNMGLLPVPAVWSGPGHTVPTKPERVLEWLQQLAPESRCQLDVGAKGRAEGMVIRNADRSKIYKLRLEDYERSLRRPNNRP